MKKIYFKELDSTNKYAKVLAKNGEEQWTVVIADRQSSGYGRMGRHFHSPEGSGLYMSIILKPRISPDKALLITTAAAVATAQAIEELTSCKTNIKWVNDIYINGRKACGILTEAAVIDKKRLEYAVLGIGVNLYEPQVGFHSDIKDIAAALFDRPTDKATRDILADSIIKNFEPFYENLEEKKFLKPYRERSMLDGENVTVSSHNSSYQATVLGIDDDFRLIIKNNDGTVATLDSGEVSVKRS